MYNRRGLSNVVSILILVVLVLTLVSIIWAIVSNLVTEVTEETENCFGIFDQIKINNEFTCYNDSSNELHISLERGQVEITKLIVSISTQNDSRLFELTKDATRITDLRYYNGVLEVKLPSEMGSRTYIAGNIYSRPKIIQIAPVVDKTTCEISDSLQEIIDCSALI